MDAHDGDPACSDEGALLDALVPRPFSPVGRLCCALLLVAATAGSGYAWSSGMFVPWPEGRWREVSRGPRTNTVELALAPDGQAVTILAWFENGSRRPVEIESVDVDLPGADVRSVSFPPGAAWPASNGSLPVLVEPHRGGSFVVTFVPRSCSAPLQASAWGTVTARLRTRAWWPTATRSYRLPAPLWQWPQRVPLGVGAAGGDPLQRACELLGRT